jgi:hypothetical protein
MRTDIEFLDRLEEDLVRVARRQLTAPRRRRRVPRSAGIAAGAAAALSVTAIIGYLALGTSTDPPLSAGPPRLEELGRNQAAERHGPVGSRDRYGIFPGLRGPGAEVGTRQPLGGKPDLRVGPKVVKTAQLSLETPEDQFDERFSEASLVASRYGGFVSTSSTQGSDARSGSLEIRVPAESFDRAVDDLRRLGTVERQTVAGEEVTAHYVDLEARILTWQAQERVLLRLMDQSKSVGESLRVQRELQDVQLEIERLQGQKRVLDDRISMGTILVQLHEKGEEKEVAVATDRPKIASGFDNAIDGFFSVVVAVIVGIGYLVPIAVLVLAAWLVIHRVRRARGLT